MNIDEFSEYLAQRIFKVDQRKQAERGLLAQDYEMFRRVLSDKSADEKLAEVRRQYPLRYDAVEKEWYYGNSRVSDLRSDYRLSGNWKPNRSGPNKVLSSKSSPPKDVVNRIVGDSTEIAALFQL